MDNLHNYSGVGINPMYGQTGQSVPNISSTTPSPQPVNIQQQHAEYDEITKPPRTIIPHQPVERKVTSNSLYASHSAALLRHPTISTVYSSAYDSTANFIEEYEEENKNRPSHCKCSPDAALFIVSLLVIILSVMAIALALLLQFGVISSKRNNPTLTTITNITNPTANTSPINSSVNSSRPTVTCDCDINDSVSTTYLLGNNFTTIHNSISIIMEGLQQLRQNENISVSERIQILSDYLTQIKAINNSLQQLRPIANRPRQPILTGLNLTANITINHDDCGEVEYECNVGGFQFDHQSAGACQTTAIPYANKTHVLVGGFGSIRSSQPLVNLTTVAMQVQPRSGEEFLPSDTTLERLRKGDLYYLCVNFNTFSVTCAGYYKQCSYQTNHNVTASISFH